MVDILYNILAAFIPLFVLQFVALPVVAQRVSSVANGEMLSVYSLCILIGSAFGSVLNNSRLVLHRAYQQENLTGDFNIIFLGTSVIGSLVTVFGVMLLTPEISVINYTLMTAATVCLVAATYLNAAFRLQLDYSSILMDACIRSIGFGVGLLVFLHTGVWSFIFFTAYFFSALYHTMRTGFIREPAIRTRLFRSTFTKYITLLGSGLMVSSGAYLDKLLLFPLLGGTAVSVYYVASIIGKTFGMVVAPMTGVMLSYFARMDSFPRSSFRKMIILLVLLGAVAYCFMIVFSRPFLSLLYPQLVEQALQYVHVTSAAFVVLSIANAVNAVLLKFRDIRWQVRTNLGHMLAYVTLSVVLMQDGGLYGFSWGLFIAALLKLIALILVFHRTGEETLGVRANSEVL